MPQMGLGKQAAMSGLLQGLIGGYGQQRQRSAEREKEGVELDIKNKESILKLIEADPNYGKDSPQASRIRQELIGLRGGDQVLLDTLAGPVPGVRQGQMPELPTVSLPGGGMATPSSIYAGRQTRERKAQEAQRVAAVARPPTGLPSPGARLVKIYDTAKGRFEELNGELATLEFTRTEPRIILGKVLNQKTLDEEQGAIDAKEEQVATVKTRMDSTIAEGRRLYGESIVFEPPTQEPPAARARLMSREEFIQAYINDPMNVQKMAPSEGIIEQAKGIDWQ